MTEEVAKADNKATAVLDHGLVRLVEHMGNDLSIVRSARVSYDAEWRTGEDEGKDAKLINYLLKNRHCYTPEMEVLTKDGWKRWDECDNTELFAVPNPDTNTFSFENLHTLMFDCDEEICVYENERMSYRVTKDHRMWFKNRNSKEGYDIYRASEMSKWGHFQCANEYTLEGLTNQDSEIGKLIGFSLGDAHIPRKGTVTFHLNKDRKKEYLRSILHNLGIKYSESTSSTYENATVFFVSSTYWDTHCYDYIDRGLKSKDKKLKFIPYTDEALMRGIFDGLVNSDGHIREDRNNRIEYCSFSKVLLAQFSTMATCLGYDCHSKACSDKIEAYPPGRTSLESRPQYHSKEHYRGKVFCATSSTGLLMVRGGPDKFGFICGNTSPFEHVKFTFEVKAPIFVFRQWHRHRTWSFNEISARYAELPEEFYVPELDQITTQSSSNKQMRTTEQHPYAQDIQNTIYKQSTEAFKQYKILIESGCPRELARSILPVGTYSHMFASVDLHNLFHFLRLRLHSHAQYEIRVYAEAMLQLIRPIVPVAVEAFEKLQESK